MTVAYPADSAPNRGLLRLDQRPYLDRAAEPRRRHALREHAQLLTAAVTGLLLKQLAYPERNFSAKVLGRCWSS